MIVHTESGSIYEIDAPSKRFRRITGKRPPSKRTAADGEWQSYDDIIDPYLGGIAIYMTLPSGKPLEMITSRVVKRVS